MPEIHKMERRIIETRRELMNTKKKLGIDPSSKSHTSYIPEEEKAGNYFKHVEKAVRLKKQLKTLEKDYLNIFKKEIGKMKLEKIENAMKELEDIENKGKLTRVHRLRFKALKELHEQNHQLERYIKKDKWKKEATSKKPERIKEEIRKLEKKQSKVLKEFETAQKKLEKAIKANEKEKQENHEILYKMLKRLNDPEFIEEIKEKPKPDSISIQKEDKIITLSPHYPQIPIELEGKKIRAERKKNLIEDKQAAFKTLME